MTSTKVSYSFTRPIRKGTLVFPFTCYFSVCLLPCFAPTLFTKPFHFYMPYIHTSPAHPSQTHQPRSPWPTSFKSYDQEDKSVPRSDIFYPTPTFEPPRIVHRLSNPIVKIHRIINSLHRDRATSAYLSYFQQGQVTGPAHGQGNGKAETPDPSRILYGSTTLHHCQAAKPSF